LILQQEGIHDYAVLSPKPSERTATAYRFEVKVPANGSQALKVEEERTYENTTEVLSSTPDFLVTLLVNRELSESGRKELQALIDLKIHLAETETSLNLAKAQMSDFTEDQTRLRQNIDSLNRVKGHETRFVNIPASLPIMNRNWRDCETKAANWRYAKRISKPRCGTSSTSWISRRPRLCELPRT
jgi:hypothetical protein